MAGRDVDERDEIHRNVRMVEDEGQRSKNGHESEIEYTY